MHRRHALAAFANGFGLVGLAGLLAEARAADAPRGITPPDPADPLAPRPPMYPAKAKRVIFLFMSGGPSHVDLFDPKPKLAEFAGKPLPFDQPKLVRTRTVNCLPSPWKFAKHGQSGADISELFPHLAKRADDLCVLRGMWADNINHNGACLQMNTGEQAFSRPSLGSWLLYGLGSENRSLPGFVVVSPSQPAQGAPLWSNSFLPAAYQGTLVANLAKPVENLPVAGATAAQRRQLDALRRLNQLHQAGREEDTALAARIASYELAFRMQAEAPEAFGVDAEPKATKDLYGVGDGPTDIFGRQCLMARRLVERGVRVVQAYHTQTAKRSSCQLWDQHGGLKSELPANCLATDKPIAGLLTDLKARGLLDDTLVIWGGEFGRTPTAEGTDGREHHPFGFTMWLAGSGVRGGITHGATDEFGWHAVDGKVHVHDLHATVLHLMGIDHERLTYRHAGRDYRLTDVHGRVVNEVLA
ncbi:MAG: DUF1501 domain-containing protein [Gemmataceae bacterium]|nr:DUF1501 domain-containing protein [Gemmataceae bacterium]